MKIPEDILRFIKQSFNKQAPAAENELRNYLKNGPDYLKSDRLMRCLLYLAEGDLATLQHVIEAAEDDPRDLIFWAEYEDRDSSNPRRVRDFSLSLNNQHKP